MHYMKKFNSDIKGFTLMELIIVIAILGILAVIAVPRLLGYTQTTEVAVDGSNLGLLNRITEIYKATNETEYIVFASASTSDDSRMTSLVGKGYISEAVEPLEAEKEFQWDSDHEIWGFAGASSSYVLQEGNQTIGAIGKNYKIRDYVFMSARTDIFIPETIKDNDITKIITKIGSKFAYGTLKPQDEKLTSVSFDSDSKIAILGNRSFMGNDLTEIVLPDSIKKIKGKAFAGNDIKRIVIGSGVDIANNAFDVSIKAAYATGGAGVYDLVDGSWVKQ